jgi:hypothetical protein
MRTAQAALGLTFLFEGYEFTPPWGSLLIVNQRLGSMMAGLAKHRVLGKRFSDFPGRITPPQGRGREGYTTGWGHKERNNIFRPLMLGIVIMKIHSF